MDGGEGEGGQSAAEKTLGEGGRVLILCRGDSFNGIILIPIFKTVQSSLPGFVQFFVNVIKKH